jgi:peptidoglycan L-alanyl-D-glutamate endopeptidase CwlK
MAIDMGPYFKELKNTDWEVALAFAAFAGAVLTIAKQLYMAGKISLQVIWGGDWDSDGRTRDHKFRDYPHFELTEENVWNL